MSIEQLRSDQILAVIEQLAEAGHVEFRPGHIADALRSAGQPMLNWEIRGELSRLEAEALITSDQKTGAYSLSKSASRKTG